MRVLPVSGGDFYCNLDLEIYFDYLKREVAMYKVRLKGSCCGLLWRWDLKPVQSPQVL
jgi:hypothetical protein